MILVNIWGGPCTGKSSTAYLATAILKTCGVNCELVTEFAKDLVWQNRLSSLQNCSYVFGTQFERIRQLEDKVDVVITDSPLELVLLYTPPDYPVEFREYVKKICSNQERLDFLMCKTLPFSAVGRTQNEAEAIELQSKVRGLMDELEIEYTKAVDPEKAATLIIHKLRDKIKGDIDKSLHTLI
jgi:hypothetical protein